MAQIIITEDSDLMLFGCEKVNTIKYHLENYNFQFENFGFLGYLQIGY